jgi:spermidine synthase
MDPKAAQWLAAFVLMLMLLVARSRRLRQPVPWIYVLFFCSGFPALIYQIVWQRALFGIYGVNVESVTVVVSAFMAGLGLGSLIGGAVSRRAKSLLPLFAIAELGTAVCGIFSLQVFGKVAEFTAGAPTLATAGICFGLVVIPTVLMGATLPLLVEHIVRATRNVGFAVGGLYFVNTLGSAAACFVAGDVLMRWLGQTGSVRFAAMINAVVGTGVLLYSLMRPAAPQHVSAASGAAPEQTQGLPLRFSLALLAAAFSGFLALSYEIIWYRLLTFASGALARAFAFLLGSYLLGVALGSRWIEGFTSRANGSGRSAILRRLGWIMLVSAGLSFTVAPLSGLIAPVASVYTIGGASVPAYLMLLPLMGAGAFFFGATFPLISHLAVNAEDRAGSRLSYLYAANILGSTLGSIVVGFILMDHFSLRGVTSVLLITGTAFAAVILAQSRPSPRTLYAVLAGSTVAVGLLIVVSGPIFGTIYDRLMFKKAYPRLHFQQVVETHSDAVGVTPDGTIYGGGLYDGRFNTELTRDVNMIVRAYALSAIHPSPRHVLMIGLASGSWAQVIANNPEVETLTIVEINAGYLKLIPQHPQVASLLQNAKVRIEIDDGRRWLVRNQQAHFDAIVMNNSLHWRDHASNLLSVEFLRIARRHLNEGGVLFYNATSSDDVLATGISVFPYGLRFMNCLAVSDSPIVFDRDRWRANLLGYRIDNRLVLDAAGVERIVNVPDDPTGRSPYSFETDGELRRRLQHLLIITDDNMGVEWRG